MINLCIRFLRLNLHVPFVASRQTISSLASCFSHTFYDLQAYTMELEAEVQKLKEINAELQKKQVQAICTISVQLIIPFLIFW
jgi:hypothetical protein